MLLLLLLRVSTGTGVSRRSSRSNGSSGGGGSNNSLSVSSSPSPSQSTLQKLRDLLTRTSLSPEEARSRGAEKAREDLFAPPMQHRPSERRERVRTRVDTWRHRHVLEGEREGETEGETEEEGLLQGGGGGGVRERVVWGTLEFRAHYLRGEDRLVYEEIAVTLADSGRRVRLALPPQPPPPPPP